MFIFHTFLCFIFLSISIIYHFCHDYYYLNYDIYNIFYLYMKNILVYLNGQYISSYFFANICIYFIYWFFYVNHHYYNSIILIMHKYHNDFCLFSIIIIYSFNNFILFSSCFFHYHYWNSNNITFFIFIN